VPVHERVFGPEHAETLSALRSRADWTGMAGDAAGGRDELAALVPGHERVLGPEHPDTLSARYRLAYWTGETGGLVGALAQLEALFSRFYARITARMDHQGLADLRREMLGGLVGQVIEVGCGNGMNFAYYPPTVSQVHAIEPEPHLRDLALSAARRAPVP
jgi:hypothetical protein